MAVRQSIKSTSNDPSTKAERLPTGYDQPGIPSDFNIPSCGLEDIDKAIFDLFDKEINFLNESIFSILYFLDKRSAFLEPTLEENIYRTFILHNKAALMCSSTILPDPIIDRFFINVKLFLICVIFY